MKMKEPTASPRKRGENPAQVIEQVRPAAFDSRLRRLIPDGNAKKQTPFLVDCFQGMSIAGAYCSGCTQTKYHSYHECDTGCKYLLTHSSEKPVTKKRWYRISGRATMPGCRYPSRLPSPEWLRPSRLTLFLETMNAKRFWI